jgi:hypothetical protein
MSRPRTRLALTLVLGLSLAVSSAALAQTFTLSGVVFGGGDPLPSTAVEALQDGTTVVIDSATTDSAGRYALSVAAAIYDLRVSPPAGSGFGQEVIQNVVVSANTTHDVILLSAHRQATLTGTIRGLGGQPLQNAAVRAYSATTGEYFGQVSTGADGSYSLLVTQGNVHLYMQGYGDSVSAPGYWEWDRYNFPVPGDLVVNADLPVVRVSGTVINSGGAPVPLVNLSVSGYAYDGGDRYFSSGVNTAADGSYAFLALQGSASVTLNPPSGSPYTRTTESLALSGDLQRDFVLPSRITATLTGTIRGLGGQPLQNAAVRAYSATTGEYFGQVSTSADGSYSLLVTQGNVHLYMQGYGDSVSAPGYWEWDRYNFPVPGDLEVDAELPVVRVSGEVTDSNGAPVPAVNLSMSGYAYDGGDRYFSAGVNSAADGSYALLALRGSASAQIRPPQGSGFSQANLSGLNLSGNLAQSIVLQRPDSTPPQIVAGPVVIHLSDTSVSIAWTTNEPATSVVDFGIGSLQRRLTSNVLTLEHLVTLIDLDPQAIYSYRAASTDRSGNGPVTSAIGTFTTQAPPGDVTPPVFTSAPGVTFADQTTALVEWTTDEPATTQVEYGETEALGRSRLGASFDTTHRLSLASLSADTQYFVRVRSEDPDGNRTTSGIFSFRTAAVPDTQPPAITAGPTFTSITDRRFTVAWTTDEPATSGVSYNDGTVFQVISDDALAVEHSLTVSGLAPQTTYHVTVSSRDAVANGPTLAGPADVTTAATPDTTAPAISSLTIGSVTESSAVVRWTTDELASGIVRYGVASLDHQVADISLDTAHEFRLAGLAERTTYRIVVRSTDASGNAAESAQLTFTTLSSVVDTPPTPASALAANPNPNNSGTHTLVWVAASDNDGPIASYQVLRNGSVAGTLPGAATSFTEAGLPQGTYLYVVRAFDGAGQRADSDPLEVIVDTTAPALILPADIVTPATSPTDALVSYEASASDDGGGSPTVDCSPRSGASFPIATTTVACTATDAAGNSAEGSFRVTVRDVFPPVLTVPADMTVDATSVTGAQVVFYPSAVDNVDADPAVACNPVSGTTFAIGTTTVSCSARDASGNTSPLASFEVTVAGAASQVAATESLLIGFHLPGGISDALQAKLVAAQSPPTPQAGCNTMSAFMKQVSAQSGKALTIAQAAQLLGAAAQIMEVMGCH